jgi:hypothetical protein
MKIHTLVALALLAASSPVSAGPFNDKLAICLVEKTTESDKTALMRWIFGAMARHPGVRDLSTVSDADADRMNKDVATLFWELLSDRCAVEMKEAVKYEGTTALRSSFEVLGKVAMQGLMADADVTAYMGGLDKHLDADKMQALLTEPAN